jgi:hypothetical protein
MESKNMASIETAGTSSEGKIKEQYENMKSLKDYCGAKVGGNVK